MHVWACWQFINVIVSGWAHLFALEWIELNHRFECLFKYTIQVLTCAFKVVFIAIHSTFATRIPSNFNNKLVCCHSSIFSFWKLNAFQVFFFLGVFFFFFWRGRTLTNLCNVLLSPQYSYIIHRCDNFNSCCQWCDAMRCVVVAFCLNYEIIHLYFITLSMFVQYVYSMWVSAHWTWLLCRWTRRTYRMRRVCA